MSISFGNTGRKPYVGSKEVQEAYVGGQKVYSAEPPIYYAFLGAENNYVLAPWATIAPQNTAIAKLDGVFRVALSGSGATSSRGYFSVDEIKAPVLRFTHYGNTVFQLLGTSASGNRQLATFGASPGAWKLETFTIPADITSIKLQKTSSSSSAVTIYLDAVRLENE